MKADFIGRNDEPMKTLRVRRGRELKKGKGLFGETGVEKTPAKTLCGYLFDRK